MRFAVAAVLVALSAQAFQATSAPLTRDQRALLVRAHEYHAGCPVTLSGLRVLGVSYWGFDHTVHQGTMVVNANAVAPLTTVFHKLYDLRFPVHYMSLADAYGPHPPASGDVTASFECRQAVKSPCNKGGSLGNGNWSEHAYGEAVDLNPVENPYVGCGQTRDKTAVSFMKRTPLRRGMVTPAVLAVFHSVGWGWGGSWYGSTKDYMHFSQSGH
jgi:D-alanyl-D-alanine carboxypeptidase